MTDPLPRDASPEELEALWSWHRRTGCPHPDLILPALEGTLPEPPLDAVRSHVADCGLCTELAHALAGADATDQERARIDLVVRRVARPPASLSFRGFAAAAAVLLVAGAAYVLTRSERTAAPATPAAPARLSAPQAPVLALAVPTIELPPESLRLRGPGRSGAIDELERGLESFQRGDYAAAAARLADVAGRDPGSHHARFYLGAARLLHGDAGGAVEPLSQARALAGPAASLYPQATWYLAVALERSGRVEDALQPLGELCAARGVHAAEACDGLSRLAKR